MFSNKRFVLAAVFAALAWIAPAQAQQAPAPQFETIEFNISTQNLGAALVEFGQQSGQELLYSGDDVVGLTGNAVQGEMTRRDAMATLLQGTGLEFDTTPSGGMIIGTRATLDARRAEWEASAAGQNTVGQRRPGIEEIIVTGQKKEERIQDVPIAISAFTQEDLTTSQIAGGPDLHLQVPNMTFTKTNFTGYSIQIRGIGTQAISATTDPAVAVALNNTPFIRNRFFEQEFFDMERVEVLRGPQGTLFGRNATAGVVNLITAKPKFQHESMLSLDMGNYHSRRWEGMVNLPIVEDSMALRIAGAGTKRDGYVTNEITNTSIDGRDLWSSRVSLRFAPTNGNFDATLIWEHFEEDDDRLRSGKQLCKKDVVTEVAGRPRPGRGGTGFTEFFTQGCTRESLYSEESFQTPQGSALPYYNPLSAIFLPANLTDPYVEPDQSRDLRVIESTVDPEYRARSDIGQLQISYELTDTLILDSETAYSTDEIFSTQDLNRFNTASGAWQQPGEFGSDVRSQTVVSEGPNGGIFCDPQIGCADRLVAVDLSTAESSQFSQELRLSSQFSGPFNFSLGANYLRYDTEDKYYVFINSLTLQSAIAPFATGVSVSDDPYVPGVTDNVECLANGRAPSDPTQIYGVAECVYIDPNPIGELNDNGHNYFLSKNPYNLRSYAVFGETYFNLTDNLKLTAGLRWSVDQKSAPRIPSWLFAANSYGHPVLEVTEQEWREPTGRLVLDWKPTLDFTDETLVYGSIARGYKAGGANPPPFVYTCFSGCGNVQAAATESATRPKTFDAEYVDAFEVGTKNTLADSAVTLNLAAFYYDYEGYQVSEIVDRSAFNRNFDVEVWGAELEADWWVAENLRLGFKGGYQKTRIADGEQAIDLMDRTAGGKHLFITDIPNPNYTGTPGQGRPRSEYVGGLSFDDIPEDQEFWAYDDWEVIKPFPTYPSNCVLPAYIYLPDTGGFSDPGEVSGGNAGGCEAAYLEGIDPVTQLSYVPDPTIGGSGGSFGVWDDYPGWDPASVLERTNNGEGFFKDLGGNELPNAPDFTATFKVDYIVPLRGDWIMTAHTDIYWQSESWWRIFNDHEYNRLDDYFTMNLAAIFTNDVSGWNVMAYIKNVTDEDAITGAFLYSDDLGLPTNVFLVEPQLFGIRATKRWDGGGPTQWVGRGAAALLGKEPGEPSPFSLTVGGQLLRPKEANNQVFAPEFVSAFDPNIDPSREQGKDMGWGDGREIKLTYAPENGWRFSLGVRFGEDSRSKDKTLVGKVAKSCVVPQFYCAYYYEYSRAVLGINPYEFRTNYGRSDLTQVEEHLLIDFQVGREVGIGGLTGTFSAGLRYAHFESQTDVVLGGTPNWELPPGSFWFAPATRNEYDGTMQARREFKGVGPVVEWESSSLLFGDESAGHLDLDWSLSGGVLFGKQETSARGGTEDVYFYQTAKYFGGQQIEGDFGYTSRETTSFDHERDDGSIEAVPTLGASLGLTYRLDGGSIGLGYSWERYYGAIDGGIEERKSFDRTVEGPYLKVTFGGGS